VFSRPAFVATAAPGIFSPSKIAAMTKQIHIPQHLLFDGSLPSDEVLRQLENMQPAEAGLPEWKRVRLGKITASRFHLVKKLKTGDWGDTALSHLYDLVGEHITGEPSETFSGNDATAWGNEYEKEALRTYTIRTGRKTKPGGFLQHPELQFCGGTPDAFCGEKGIVEVKCPWTYKHHLRTAERRTAPEEYLPQVYGHLWLSGRDWVDFVSFHPRIWKKSRTLGLVIVRVTRKEHAHGIASLAERVTEFHELLLEKLAALKVKPSYAAHIQSIKS